MKVLFLTLILCINAGAAAVSAPHGNGVANEKVNVPIWAEQLDGVIEYGFKIAYDPNILAPVDDGCTTYLTMAYQMTSVCTIERVGEVLDTEVEELWGGKQGAYLVAATGRRGPTTDNFGQYYAAGSEIIGTITVTTPGATTGRTYMEVIYSVGTSVNAIATGP